MFDWFFYIVAVLLAAPVVAVIALVRSIQLNKRLRGVELKLAMLERQSAPPVSSPPQAVARPPPAPPKPASTTVREAPISPVPPAPSSPPRASSPGSVPSFPQANATPAAHTISFEERFGTRWVVWIGGVALALGGVFLVRYSIQQGLVGPGVRILLGSLLALALIFAGERQWRNEKQLSLPGVPTANIPSVLTAAGTTVAYATVYTAYALYGFLPPVPPSCFSERWLWRLWQPPCCTGPHSPGSASSARIWRQCWSRALSAGRGASGRRLIAIAAAELIATARAAAMVAHGRSASTSRYPARPRC